MAFEQFKEECGSEISRIFKENKSILLARKKRSSTVARRINFIKQEMEDIKKALEAQRQERWQQGKSLARESLTQEGATGFRAVLVDATQRFDFISGLWVRFVKGKTPKCQVGEEQMG